MTLKEWAEKNGRKILKVNNNVVGVPCEDPDLWLLSDYEVSSVAKGTVWLVPKMVYIVIMIEPSTPGETLTVSQQINEVFGPFATEADAEVWAGRMADIYKNSRTWHITDLASPTVINMLDTRTN